VGPTHTKGDTALFVEGDAVLFAGDVVMNKSFVAANQNSSIKAWLAAFDAFAALRPRVIVPSHGPIGDGALIPALRTVMLSIETRARELKKQGTPIEDVATTVAMEERAKHPDWARPNGLAALARSAYTEAP